jgi:hypothetical protein
MKLFVRSAILVTAAALVPLMPVAAHAKTYTYEDQTGDVVLFSTATGTTSPAPTQVEGDIVWSQVRHKARKVVLTMRLQELTTANPALHWYGIRTGKMKRIVLLEGAPGHWGGKVALFKPSGKKVSCRVTRTIDYTANTATVRVPRSCLGRPRWVKVAMQEATPGPTEKTVYVDDARSTGGVIPVYGPKVRR